MADTRPLYAYAVIDPCIVLGCSHEYGHEGAHDALDLGCQQRVPMSAESANSIAAVIVAAAARLR